MFDCIFYGFHILNIRITCPTTVFKSVNKPSIVKEIQIVDKIYESEIFSETVGLWIPAEGRVLTKRKQLEELSKYAGTLLHECGHAISGAGDVSRDFEAELTDIIGVLASKLLSIS